MFLKKIVSVALSLVISASPAAVSDVISAVEDKTSAVVEKVSAVQESVQQIAEEAPEELVANVIDKISAVDQSVVKVCDNFYVMDYCYDYDINDIVKNGYICTADMLLQVVGDYILTGSSNGFACSTFNAVTPDGDYILGRNFDYMDAPRMLVRTDPTDGYASIAMLNLELIGYDGFTPDSTLTKMLSIIAPYAIVDGINEKGLCVGVLEIEKDPTVQLSLKTNITTTSMIRIVLDKAETVDEAVELFGQYDMIDLLVDTCTYHYQIADAYGNSAIIEYVDNEMKVIYPEHNDGNVVDYQAATNFLLTPDADDPDGIGQDRYDTMMTALNTSKGVLTESEAMDLLQSVSVQDEDMNGYICSTLWSCLYNASDKVLSLCLQNNFDSMFTFSIDKPLASQLD